MRPHDILDRLRHRPAAVAVVAALVVGALLLLVLRPGSSSGAPGVSTSTSSLAAQAAQLPAVAPAPAASPSVPAASDTAPATEPAGSAPAVEPAAPAADAPADGASASGPLPYVAGDQPVVNDKSLPMVDDYTPPAPAPQQVTIAQPVGGLYQRNPDGGSDSFTPVSSLPSDATVVALIHATFPQAEWSRAERIAGCESGMRSVSSKPNSNGTRDHGVFQLNDGGTLQGLLRTLGQDPSAVSLALDPAWNVKAAHVLWTQRGWQPWSCAARLGIVDGMWSSTPGPNW